MAVWQYDLMIKGKRSFVKPDFEKVQRLVQVLPELPPWTDHMRWWGSEEGDRVDVFFDESGEFELSARVDVRRMHKPFIKLLSELAEVLQAEIIDENESVVERSAIGIETHIQLNGPSEYEFES